MGRTLDAYEDMESELVSHQNQLSLPIRTSISIRSYRASFPFASNSGLPVSAEGTTAADSSSSGTASARTLSVIVYSDPILPAAQGGQGQTQTGLGVRDDVSYLFIEDRLSSSPDSGTGAGGVQGSKQGVDGKIGAGTVSADDDFEIIDPPGTEQTGASTTDEAGLAANAGVPAQSAGSGTRTTYQTLAVRPASSVQSLLHQISSPFVLGATKSARTAASTTAEKAAASKLAGTLFTLSSFTFPALQSPYPSIVLTVHVNSAPQVGMIILEAELLDPDGAYADSEDTELNASRTSDLYKGSGKSMDVEVLTEFLEGCIPDVPLALGGIQSDVNIVDPGVTRHDGHLERMKKVTGAMAKMLREAGYI